MEQTNNKDVNIEERNEKLIQDAFQHLIDTYLASRHRKKVEIITKPTKE